MSTNAERAEWARCALEEFSDQCGPSLEDDEDCENAIADLIGNLGHYAEQRGLDFVKLVSHGVGMWSAERRAPLIPELGNEPGANDIVTVRIDQVPTPADIQAAAEGH